MALPPGHEAKSVLGFDASVNPNLTRAAGEVAAWIDYLLHPQDNDGPRVYRSLRGDPDSPFPNRNEDLDSRTAEFETVSILDDFADDSDALLRPVQAIAGMQEHLLSGTYDKLAKGYLTWQMSDRGPGPDAIVDEKLVHYAEANSARMDWMQMHIGADWSGTSSNRAYLYEEAFLKYQVITENCLYVVAEHLTRYWAIFDKAGKDLLELMDAFTEECAAYDPLNSGAGLALNIPSIVVAAIIAATVTVLTTNPASLTMVEVLKSAASAARCSRPPTGPRRSTSRSTSTTTSRTPPGSTSTASRRSSARSPTPSPAWPTAFGASWSETADCAGTRSVATPAIFSEAIPRVADFQNL